MSISIQISEASFSKSLASLSIPDRDRLVGEYVFGGDYSTSRVNTANPSLPLVVAGEGVVYSANSATVKSGTDGYGFATGIVPRGDSTWISIRKKPQYHGALLIGGIQTQRYGFDAYGGNTYFRNSLSNLTQGPMRPTPVHTDFYFEAGRFNYAGLAQLFWYEAGVQQSSTSANAGLSFLPPEVRIGGAALPASTPSTHEHAYFALFNRPLSPAQIDEVYQSLKVFMATRGVAI